jgi:DNA-binding SARP family transcriptional activator
MTLAPAERLPVVTILGPMTIRHGDAEVMIPAKLDRSVLAHLVLAEGRALSVDMLIEAVWGGRPPPRARNSLQVKISRLRGRLGELGTKLEFTQGSYRLRLSRDQIDVAMFSDRVASARSTLDSGDVPGAHDDLSAALVLWRGEPLADLDEHPRLVAARSRLHDEWMTAQELMADIELRGGAPRPQTFERLRKILDLDPRRPTARLLLMQALEKAGRRAEALAVYDAGRRVLADETGLTPPAELRAAFEAMLADERRASRRTAGHEVTNTAPTGAIETARWLANQGEPSAAIRLAIRGAWWWWFGGARSEGRDLFEDLTGAAASTSNDRVENPDELQAAAWLSVFKAGEADAVAALANGEDALGRAKKLGWGRPEALAAALLAERLYQRGEPARADGLLTASRQQFAADADAWGVAVADVIEAKAIMLRGEISRAHQASHALIADFEELGDTAGQVMALDIAGYCAEIRGELSVAARIHRRALELARQSSASEWEAAQLTRIGSILALAGTGDAGSILAEAHDLASGIGSDASLALARNAMGLRLSLNGEMDEAVISHEQSLAWYERQGSRAGVSYSAGRLACDIAADQPDRALALAERSVALAAETNDPRAVAHGLETLARVSCDPVQSARALGGARALRLRTNAPLPAVLNQPLLQTERRLLDELGDALARELRVGARQSTRIATLAEGRTSTTR